MAGQLPAGPAGQLTPAGRDAWPGPVAGLVAALVALATGEVVAGLHERLTSPVVDVGDLIIDRVPMPVASEAIDWFGTSDKAVLVVGIVFTCALLGAVLGTWADRRPGAAAAAFGAFALVGAFAAARQPEAAPLSFLPSAAAAAAGAASLVGLRRAARAAPEPVPGAVPGSVPGAEGRRAFLALAGAGVVSAAALAAGGRWLQGRTSAVASRLAVRLPRPVRPAPPVPPGALLEVDGVAPLITPTSDFYRIDTALVLPQVRAEDWSLRVTGMVDRELELSFDDLLARPLVEEVVTLACVSNPVGGDLVGTARWLGAPLADLLREAGVRPDADQVVGRSVDGFTAGFPLAAALDGRPALVVVGMNGEPLPIRHGFPARLLVPGLYGYVSATKWLREIELTRFDQFDAYWIRRGWAREGPIKLMARIDTPGGRVRPRPGPVTVAGVAWAPTVGVARVEVRVDDGPWVDAELADPVNDLTWRQWRYVWTATPGRHRLAVRATGSDGRVQPEHDGDPFPSGAGGWHVVSVRVEG